MKKTFCTIALMGLAGCGFAQNSAIYKADVLLQKQEYTAAIPVLEEIVANPKTTKLSEAYYKLGVAHASIFNTELAKAAASVPFDTVAFNTHLDHAVEAFTRSHEEDIKPDKKGKVKPEREAENKLALHQMLDYYKYAGVFANMNGDNKASLDYFEKYINMPNNPAFTPAERDSIYTAGRANYSQAAINCALLNYNMKNWDGVLRNAEIALRDTMNLHDLFIMKYSAQLQKGDTLGYAETLKEAVARTSSQGFMGDLITYYMNKRDRVGAISMADDLIAKAPTSKTSYYIKGCLEMNMPPYDYEAARRSFEQALKIDPNYLEANTNMGICWVNDITDRLNADEFKIPTSTDDASNKLRRKIMQEKVYPYYNAALPYFEKVREMAPDRPELWAQGLYNTYYSLMMDDKVKEILPFLPNKN